jgi:hypothetical protein
MNAIISYRLDFCAQRAGCSRSSGMQSALSLGELIVEKSPEAEANSPD